MSNAEVLDAAIRVPDHVIHRAFVAETVVLNLRTGKYHGLNPTAGRMLVVLEQAGSVRAAVAPLAKEYGQDAEVVSRDLAQLCRDLLDRKLIEVIDASAR